METRVAFPSHKKISLIFNHKPNNLFLLYTAYRKDECVK